MGSRPSTNRQSYGNYQTEPCYQQKNIQQLPFKQNVITQPQYAIYHHINQNMNEQFINDPIQQHQSLANQQLSLQNQQQILQIQNNQQIIPQLNQVNNNQIQMQGKNIYQSVEELEGLYKNIHLALINFNIIKQYNLSMIFDKDNQNKIPESEGVNSEFNFCKKPFTKESIDYSIQLLNEILSQTFRKYNENISTRTSDKEELNQKTKQLNQDCAQYLNTQLQQHKNTLQNSYQTLKNLYQKFTQKESEILKQTNNNQQKYIHFLSETYHQIDTKKKELIAKDCVKQTKLKQLDQERMQYKEFISTKQQLNRDEFLINQDHLQLSLVIKEYQKEIEQLELKIDKNSNIIKQAQIDQEKSKILNLQLYEEELKKIKEQIEKKEINILDNQTNKKIEDSNLQILINYQKHLIQQKESKQKDILDIHVIYVIDGSSSMNDKYQACIDAVGRCVNQINSKFDQNTYKTLNSVLQFSDSCQSKQKYGLKHNEIDLQQYKHKGGKTNYNSAFQEIEKIINQFKSQNQQFIVLFFTDGAPSDIPNPIKLIELKSQLQNKFFFFGLGFQKQENFQKLVQQINQNNNNMQLFQGQNIPTYTQIDEIKNIIEAFHNIYCKVQDKRNNLIKQKEDLEIEIKELSTKIEQEEQEIKLLQKKYEDIQELMKKKDSSENASACLQYLTEQVNKDKILLQTNQSLLQKKVSQMEEIKQKLSNLKEIIANNSSSILKKQEQIQQLQNDFEYQFEKEENYESLKIFGKIQQNLIDLQNDIDQFTRLSNYLFESFEQYSNNAKSALDTSNRILQPIDIQAQIQQFHQHMNQRGQSSDKNIFEDLLENFKKDYYLKFINGNQNFKEYFRFLNTIQQEIFDLSYLNDRNRQQQMYQILNSNEIYQQFQESRTQKQKDLIKNKLYELVTLIMQIILPQSNIFNKLLLKQEIILNYSAISAQINSIEYNNTIQLKLKYQI